MGAVTVWVGVVPMRPPLVAMTMYSMYLWGLLRVVASCRRDCMLVRFVEMVVWRPGGRRGWVGVVGEMGGLCFVHWEVLVGSVVVVNQVQVCKVYIDRRSCLCWAMARLVKLDRCWRPVCCGRGCGVG